MRVAITSLSGHRIDELLADYAFEALKDHKEHEFYRCRMPSESKCDAIWVFNGLNNSEQSEKLVKLSNKISTYYFWDDHSLPTFDSMTTVSQFEGMGDIFFQISELALFDSKWDVNPLERNKKIDFCYWGHIKEERQKYYLKYIEPMSFKNSLLIGEFEEQSCITMPYTRDFDELYSAISHCKTTIVFGDDMHNGRSIPLRVYEAAMNGLVVYFDKELVEGQSFEISEEYIIDNANQIEPSDYLAFRDSLLKGNIEQARQEVRNKLEKIIGRM